MFQDQLINTLQKVSTMQHVFSGMALAHFRTLINELLNKDPYIVTYEAPLIVMDIKSAICMAKNGRDTKHTRKIARILHFVRNGEKYKMQKID